MEKIPIKLRKRPFSTKEAIQSGISKTNLGCLVEEGILNHLNHGIYEVADNFLNGRGDGHGSGWGMGSGSGAGNGDGSGGDDYSQNEKDYIMATLKCGFPSAVCLLSALEYYHITGQVADKTWILVPENKRIAFSHLRLVRSRHPQWDFGIRKMKDYWITSLERTLIDCIVYKKIIGNQVALEALKRAHREKKLRLKNMIDLAKKMKILHRILPYMEVLAS